MAEPAPSPEALAEAVVAGERRALARAITLIESDRATDEDAIERLLDALLPHAGRALLVGVSGPPGVGKSTLIDALGRHAIGLGESVAVLAVDPSSERTGGSVLADKTRMGRLALEAKSFIRPSPSRGATSGVARGTREALLACDAAGYTLVLLETVGVGQGQHAAQSMVDCFVVVSMPGAGDELQGMKRGILEVADIVAVNKADGADAERAERAASELSSALRMLARRAGQGPVPVLALSAESERGVPELWTSVRAEIERARQSGELERRRADGRRAWFREEIEALLRARLRSGPEADARLAELERAVLAGALGPRRAARSLLALASG